MSKDIGMGVRKGTVVSSVPTLSGYFLWIPSLYVFSFVKCFCDFIIGHERNHCSRDYWKFAGPMGQS